MPEEDTVDGPPAATARPQTFTETSTTRVVPSSRGWQAGDPTPGVSASPSSTFPPPTGCRPRPALRRRLRRGGHRAYRAARRARRARPGQRPGVFREYDLEGQFQIMRQGRAAPRCPCLACIGSSATRRPRRTVLRAEKRYGIVPPDIMPYPFGGNWLFDAPVRPAGCTPERHDRRDRRAPRDRSAEQKFRSSISTALERSAFSVTSVTGLPTTTGSLPTDSDHRS